MTNIILCDVTASVSEQNDPVATASAAAATGRDN